VSITGIKGMNDILPGEVETWQFMEETARRVFKAYGFAEIRVPVVEKTELFKRSIGETTDIVEKEMYTFNDRSDNSMTLRPEGTAPVMRAYCEHKLYALDAVTKLYYLGPMFRYERPQKGRYRQFHQIGAEAIGVSDPKIDAQILAMLTHFFAEAEIPDVSLQINSLGCPACRPAYREKLIAALEDQLPLLCEDCRRRFRTNPLRVIDCKVPGCQTATVNAPAIIEHLCPDCNDHFSTVNRLLGKMEIPFTVNPRMVRGLDYYTRTTFEMVTNSLGAQNAVAAGGRYDGLIQEIGGPDQPGIGFAMGIERLVLLKGQKSIPPQRPDLFIAALGQEAGDWGFLLATKLQRLGVSVELDYAGKSLKSQMRRADKLQARHVLIVGEDEIHSGTAQIKDMDAGTQSAIALDQIETNLPPLLRGELKL
jgi:histidyl-tRNA synthetase